MKHGDQLIIILKTELLKSRTIINDYLSNECIVVEVVIDKKIQTLYYHGIYTKDSSIRSKIRKYIFGFKEL